MYDELVKLINDSKDYVDFAPFGKGISKEWIESAEKRLCIEFPESYKWWLSNYKGGEIYGEEVYSIYGLDFDNVVGGDIVYINELNRKNDEGFMNKLIISEPYDQLFYFDLSQGLIDGEYLIYEYFSKTLYAKSFVEFLYKRITE